MSPEYEPGLGRVQLTPIEDVTACSWSTWVLEYTAGERGVKPSGKISFGLPHGFSIPQNDNPSMSGWCTAQCSRNDISLVLRAGRDFGLKYNTMDGQGGRPHCSFLWVMVCEETLREGDKIWFTYGDTTQGGPGSMVRAIEGEARFETLVCPESSWSYQSHFYLLKDCPKLNITARKPTHLTVIAPSVMHSQEQCDLYFAARDEFDNTCHDTSVRVDIRGMNFVANQTNESSYHSMPKVLRYTTSADSVEFIRTMQVKYNSPAFSGVRSNPIRIAPPSDSDYIFWGDLHAHSNALSGLNDPEAVYTYARDIGRLDFCAITEQDYMFDESWQRCRQAVEKSHQDGQFVCFPGYEHCWNDCPQNPFLHAPGGVTRCVYFNNSQDSVLIRSKTSQDKLVNQLTAYHISSQDEDVSSLKVVDSIEELFRYLEMEKTMVIPSIRQNTWEHHDPVREPVAEIYSAWGSREYIGCPLSSIDRIHPDSTIQASLAKGCRIGFVAGSDGYSGRPGNDNWLRFFKGFSSGLTAVMAKKKTRNDIWDALRNRSCYATTGQRIIVRFFLNEQKMGSIVPLESATSNRHLTVEVYGTDRLRCVTIVKNNQNVFDYRERHDQAIFDWDDSSPAADNDYYYLRIIQDDQHMAWSSPIWIAIDEKERS